MVLVKKGIFIFVLFSGISTDLYSVVFSFWTTTLDSIALALDNSSKYVQYDGRSSAAARTAAMQAFRDDSDVRVMLISLSCGAEG